MNATVSTLPKFVQELGGVVVEILDDAQSYATRPVTDAQLYAVGRMVKWHPVLNTEKRVESLLDLVNYYGVNLNVTFGQRVDARSFETVALAHEYVAEMLLGGRASYARWVDASWDVGTTLLFIDYLRDTVGEPSTIEELDLRVESFGGFSKVRGIVGLEPDVVTRRVYDETPEKDVDGYPFVLPEEQDQPEDVV